MNGNMGTVDPKYFVLISFTCRLEPSINHAWLATKNVGYISLPFPYFQKMYYFTLISSKLNKAQMMRWKESVNWNIYCPESVWRCWKLTVYGLKTKVLLPQPSVVQFSSVQCSLYWVGIIIGKHHNKPNHHTTTPCVITFRVELSSV